jgi:hypothetical protein
MKLFKGVTALASIVLFVALLLVGGTGAATAETNHTSLVTKASSAAASSAAEPSAKPECDENSPLCAEVFHSVGYAGGYTGHDEPALLFYSDTAGSGSSMTYRVTVPTEPPTPPRQDGSGGTDNFQLRPTFWIGMALCNDESSPNPGGSSVGAQVPCTPNSDSNIYNSPDPSSPQYIGRHPGTAFLELQFYPPGWAPFQAGGISCDATKWCVAMVIWSLAENDNTGQELNTTCQKVVGLEYPNFAFLTHHGASQAPANPVEATGATFTPDASRDLFMNGGDQLTVDIHDTADGLFTGVTDHNTGESGSMTASAANDFGEVEYIPTGRACNNIPYDFHPMYSTSSPDTRVPWAAHSYNVSFSDEIGHFEYCDRAAPGSRKCAQAGVTDATKDGDDNFCFNASESLLVPITGCTDTDSDFDGVSYKQVWPGTLGDPAQDQSLHPSSVLFTSPLTNGQNYSRVAFEADLPRIEFATSPPCQRHLANPADPDPGAGCVNPPVGADFYPIYTTGSSAGGCVWQLGGTHIPGTTNTFGGNSATEYGTTLLALFYPAANGGPQYIYEDFRNIQSSNPCPA